MARQLDTHLPGVLAPGGRAVIESGARRPLAIGSLLRDRFELTPNPDEASRLRFAHEIKTVMGSDQVGEMLHLLGAFVGLDFAPTPFLRAITESAKSPGNS